MSTMRFNFRSQAIGYYVDVTVVLPTDEYSYFDPTKESKELHPSALQPKPLYKPGMKFQTVYLIQGGADDDSLVYRYTNAERYAQKNHVMLVTPNIVHSFGADTEYGVKYSTFLTEELPVVIQSIFPSSPAREDNFIVGYAMGGNVALGNAIMHPENYAACVDISGGIGYTVRTEVMVDELKSDHFVNGFPLYVSTFGSSEKFAGSKHDIVQYVKKYLAEGVKMPNFTVICGSKEFIRGRVEGDVAAMRELGLDINYIVREGYDHDFDMWDKSVADALNEILPLKRAAIYPD